MIAALQHRVGDHIQDRYEIQRVLGAGAFGTVYLCRDNELGVTVAVKELHVLDDPETGSNERESALFQFRREAMHLSHLRHPHIVSGHYQPHSGSWNICPICGLHFERDCSDHRAPLLEIKQRHYLVMEWVDGPHLGEATQLNGGTLPVERALRYIRQIAGALALIHERGWIHRDIKPENIRLRTQGDAAILLDFGIAGESGAVASYSTRPFRHTQGGGTTGYAPDSPQECRAPDARSDVHALGITLYQALCARDPLEPEDLATMRAHRPSYFNAAISAALDAFILRCIHPDASRRPADGAAFLEELEQLLAPKVEPASAPASQTPSKPAPPTDTSLNFRSGVRAGDMNDFLRLADEYPREAREMLFAGQLADWFERRGWLDYATQARRIRHEYAGRPAQGLEALLQSTGLVEAPRLRCEPRALNFGPLKMGESSTIRLFIDNIGRGHLFGMVRSAHLGLEFPSQIDGNNIQVPVTFHARSDLRLRGEQKGDLILDTSAGELRVPFVAKVRVRRSLAPFAAIIGWGLSGMASGQFLRSWPLTVRSGQGGWGWLDADSGLAWLPAAPAFGMALWAILLILVLAEAQRRRSCGYAFRGGALAFLAAVAAMVWGNVLLVNGDELLYPLFSPLAREFAAGGWLFAGGICGAAYGTLRRWRDIGSTRVLQLCAAWMVTMCVAYGVLAAALEAH